MPPNTRFTKQHSRAILAQLASNRQAQTPQHPDPAWAQAFWLRVTA
jgi:hypothetical protein